MKNWAAKRRNQSPKDLLSLSPTSPQEPNEKKHKKHRKKKNKDFMINKERPDFYKSSGASDTQFTPRMSMDMLDSDYGCYEINNRRQEKKNILKQNLVNFMKANGHLDDDED